MRKNTKDDRTRAIEEAHFEAFRGLVPDFPDGKVLHEDGPDFRILMPGKIIGIEHSEVYKPFNHGHPPEQAIESEIRDVIEMAMACAKSSGTLPVRVSLFFDYQQTRNKSERKEIARLISAFVCANIPPDENGIVEVMRGDANWDDRLQAVSQIQIDRLQVNTHRWWSPLVASHEVIDIRQLQQEIRRKEDKITQYRDHCDECWLLMVADSFMKPSTAVDVTQAALEHCYIASFDRVYFLGSALRQLYQLKISL